MKSLHLADVETFPFIEPPQGRAIADGYQLLQELGAVDDANALTPLGRKLAKLPLDPRVGRMILAALDNACLTEMLIIASALSVQDPRDRPMEQQQAAADQAHKKFADEKSEFLSYLKIWNWFERRDRAQENQPPAAGKLPRQLPVADAPARMARRAFAAADHRARAGLAPERSAGHLRAAAHGAADRPAGQYRLQGARTTRSTSARAASSSTSGPAPRCRKRPGKLGDGGRAGRHHAPVCALAWRRSSRNGWSGSARTC